MRNLSKWRAAILAMGLLVSAQPSIAETAKTYESSADPDGRIWIFDQSKGCTVSTNTKETFVQFIAQTAGNNAILVSSKKDLGIDDKSRHTVVLIINAQAVQKQAEGYRKSSGTTKLNGYMMYTDRAFLQSRDWGNPLKIAVFDPATETVVIDEIDTAKPFFKRWVACVAALK